MDKEAKKILRVTDLADEEGYRSGYRDAWIVCLDTFASALGTDAYTLGWDFWAEELLSWMFDRLESRLTPPQMTYKPHRKKKAPGLQPGERFAVLKRNGYRCQLCGTCATDGPHVRLEVDHYIPQAKGGKHNPGNLWTLCASCNRGKHTQET